MNDCMYISLYTLQQWSTETLGPPSPSERKDKVVCVAHRNLQHVLLLGAFGMLLALLRQGEEQRVVELHVFRGGPLHVFRGGPLLRAP